MKLFKNVMFMRGEWIETMHKSPLISANDHINSHFINLLFLARERKNREIIKSLFRVFDFTGE